MVECIFCASEASGPVRAKKWVCDSCMSDLANTLTADVKAEIADLEYRWPDR